MAYLNTTTMQYPLNERDIRDECPNISFPSPFVAPSGYAWVYQTPQPEYNPLTQRVQEVSPTEFDTMWYQAWEIVELFGSQEEIDAFMAQRLETAKQAKNLEINSERLKATYSTFKYLEKDIACDQLSRSDIDGINAYVSLFNAFPDGFPLGWKATDNGYAPISDVNMWKMFITEMTTAGMRNFKHSQELKEIVANSLTVEDVQAITWDTPTAATTVSQ